MGFMAVSVAIAAIVSLLTGGRLTSLGRLDLHRWWLLVAGVALQIAPEVVDAGATTLVAMSYACLAVFCLANLQLTGIPVVLVGLVLNAVVIVANGGMPVRADAIYAAGLDDDTDVARLDFGSKRHLESDGDRLSGLGDILAVPPLGEVLSFGDLILAAGVANVVARGLRPRRSGIDLTQSVRVDTISSQRLGSSPVRPSGADRLFDIVEAETAEAHRQ